MKTKLGFFAIMICVLNSCTQLKIAVDDLQCEYLTRPSGVDVDHPHFSWKIAAEERSVYQQAYRIIVSDKQSEIQAKSGDCWDSGWIKSDYTVNLKYEGAPLAGNHTYYWRVCAVINGQEVWSKPSVFHTGLFDETDWKAQWVGVKEEIIHQSLLFRKPFSIEKKIKEAYIYVTAAGFYELYLNGQKVDDDVLNPAITDYRKTVLYSAYDVTGLLKKGENAFGVMLGNAAYNMYIFPDRYGWGDSNPLGTPRFLLQMNVVFDDGSETTVTSGEGWKYTMGPITYNNIFGGEDYDARHEVPGWASAQTDDSGWQSAVIVPGPGGKPKWQSVPIEVTETLTPVAQTHPSEGVYLFDLGQNIAGWWRIGVKGKAGQTIRVRGSETLNKELFAKPLENGDSLNVNEPYHAHVWTDYTLKSDQKETYEPHFFYTGCRYIEVVTNDRTDLAELTTEGRVVRSALESTGTWTSSNELLNWIHEAGRWSQMGNLVGYPTDCPHREKGAYTGDGQVIAETSMHDFGMASFYAKWLNDMRDAQEVNGHIPNMSPMLVGGGGGGVAWGSAYILTPWWMYHYYNDIQTLETHYPTMKKYIDYLRNVARTDAKPNEPYIINSFGGFWDSLGEWCSPGRGDCPNHSVVSTFYYYYDALLMSKIAHLLGKHDDAHQYAALSDTIKTEFNKHFFNPQTFTYGLDSVYQTYQLLAIAGDIVPEESRDATLKTIVDDIQKRDNHLNTGLIGTKYLWRVLSDAGYDDLAFSVATQETYPSYGYWKNNHATTLLESWIGNSSHNHQMFGTITEYLYQYLAGIRSPFQTEESRGYKQIHLQPRMPDTLRMVKASLQTVAGTILSEWERFDSQYVYQVTIPSNTVATLELPTNGYGSAAEITEGNTVVWQNGEFSNTDPGIIDIKRDESKFYLSLESGTYRFVVAKK